MPFLNMEKVFLSGFFSYHFQTLLSRRKNRKDGISIEHTNIFNNYLMSI